MPDETPPRKYGCLLLPLPIHLADQLLTWVKGTIWEGHLGEGGIEEKPHITVKYGFVDDSKETVQQLRSLLAVYGPIRVKLEGLSIFKSNEDGDVLKLDVESEQLRELNAEISKTFNCVDTHPTYNPHLTLAYIKPVYSFGYALFTPPLANSSVLFTTAVWSDVDKKKEEIHLGGFGFVSMNEKPFKKNGVSIAQLEQMPSRGLSELVEEKTMSWLGPNGGDLVPPPKFSLEERMTKLKDLRSRYRRKSLEYTPILLDFGTKSKDKPQGPSKAHERHGAGKPPSLPWKPPPTPKGKFGVGPARRYKGKRSQTVLGDRAEKIVRSLGFRSILPEGRRGNISVKKDGSSLDVEYENTGWGFEVKACSLHDAEYRSKPKPAEIKGKEAYARKHNLKPATLIVVMDYEANKAHCYWHEGITTRRLPIGDDPRDWHYAGSVKLKSDTKSLETGVSHQDQEPENDDERIELITEILSYLSPSEEVAAALLERMDSYLSGKGKKGLDQNYVFFKALGIGGASYNQPKRVNKTPSAKTHQPSATQKGPTHKTKKTHTPGTVPLAKPTGGIKPKSEQLKLQQPKPKSKLPPETPKEQESVNRRRLETYEFEKTSEEQTRELELAAEAADKTKPYKLQPNDPSKVIKGPGGTSSLVEIPNLSDDEELYDLARVPEIQRLKAELQREPNNGQEDSPGAQRIRARLDELTKEEPKPTSPYTAKQREAEQQTGLEAKDEEAFAILQDLDKNPPEVRAKKQTERLKAGSKAPPPPKEKVEQVTKWIFDFTKGKKKPPLKVLEAVGKILEDPQLDPTDGTLSAGALLLTMSKEDLAFLKEKLFKQGKTKQIHKSANLKKIITLLKKHGKKTDTIDLDNTERETPIEPLGAPGKITSDLDASREALGMGPAVREVPTKEETEETPPPEKNPSFGEEPEKPNKIQAMTSDENFIGVGSKNEESPEETKAKDADLEELKGLTPEALKTEAGKIFTPESLEGVSDGELIGILANERAVRRAYEKSQSEGSEEGLETNPEVPVEEKPEGATPPPEVPTNIEPPSEGEVDTTPRTVPPTEQPRHNNLNALVPKRFSKEYKEEMKKRNAAKKARKIAAQKAAEQKLKNEIEDPKLPFPYPNKLTQGKLNFEEELPLQSKPPLEKPQRESLPPPKNPRIKKKKEIVEPQPVQPQGFDYFFNTTLGGVSEGQKKQIAKGVKITREGKGRYQLFVGKEKPIVGTQAEIKAKLQELGIQPPPVPAKRAKPSKASPIPLGEQNLPTQRLSNRAMSRAKAEEALVRGLPINEATRKKFPDIDLKLKAAETAKNTTQPSVTPPISPQPTSAEPSDEEVIAQREARLRALDAKFDPARTLIGKDDPEAEERVRNGLREEYQRNPKRLFDDIRDRVKNRLEQYALQHPEASEDEVESQRPRIEKEIRYQYEEFIQSAHELLLSRANQELTHWQQVTNILQGNVSAEATPEAHKDANRLLMGHDEDPKRALWEANNHQAQINKVVQYNQEQLTKLGAKATPKPEQPPTPPKVPEQTLKGETTNEPPVAGEDYQPGVGGPEYKLFLEQESLKTKAKTVRESLDEQLQNKALKSHLKGQTPEEWLDDTVTKIRDHKEKEISGWGDPLVQRIVEQLAELDGIAYNNGFSEDEITELLGGKPTTEGEEEPGETPPEPPPNKPKPVGSPAVPIVLPPKKEEGETTEPTTKTKKPKRVKNPQKNKQKYDKAKETVEQNRAVIEQSFGSIEKFQQKVGSFSKSENAVKWANRPENANVKDAILAEIEVQKFKSGASIASPTVSDKPPIAQQSPALTQKQIDQSIKDGEVYLDKQSNQKFKAVKAKLGMIGLAPLNPNGTIDQNGERKVITPEQLSEYELSAADDFEDEDEGVENATPEEIEVQKQHYNKIKKQVQQAKNWEGVLTTKWENDEDKEIAEAIAKEYYGRKPRAKKVKGQTQPNLTFNQTNSKTAQLRDEILKMPEVTEEYRKTVAAVEEELKQANAEIKNAWDQQGGESQEYKDAVAKRTKARSRQHKATEKTRKVALDRLRGHIGKGIEWKVTIPDNLPATKKKALEEGADFIRGLVAQGENSEWQPHVNFVYDTKFKNAKVDKQNNLVIGAINVTPNVVPHEIGHLLRIIPGVNEAVIDFAKKRFGDEELVDVRAMFPEQYPLNSGKILGRKDNFDRIFDAHNAYYAGRHYNSGDSELLSMGLEQLSRDPVAFAERDPEYFDFVVGILDGSLRGKGGVAQGEEEVESLEGNQHPAIVYLDNPASISVVLNATYAQGASEGYLQRMHRSLHKALEKSLGRPPTEEEVEAAYNTTIKLSKRLDSLSPPKRMLEASRSKDNSKIGSTTEGELKKDYRSIIAAALSFMSQEAESLKTAGTPLEDINSLDQAKLDQYQQAMVSNFSPIYINGEDVTEDLVASAINAAFDLVEVGTGDPESAEWEPWMEEEGVKRRPARKPSRSEALRKKIFSALEQEGGLEGEFSLDEIRKLVPGYSKEEVRRELIKMSNEEDFNSPETEQAPSLLYKNGQYTLSGAKLRNVELTESKNPPFKAASYLRTKLIGTDMEIGDIDTKKLPVADVSDPEQVKLLKSGDVFVDERDGKIWSTITLKPITEDNTDNNDLARINDILMNNDWDSGVDQALLDKRMLAEEHNLEENLENIPVALFFVPRELVTPTGDDGLDDRSSLKMNVVDENGGDSSDVMKATLDLKYRLEQRKNALEFDIKDLENVNSDNPLKSKFQNAEVVKQRHLNELKEINPILDRIYNMKILFNEDDGNGNPLTMESLSKYKTNEDEPESPEIEPEPEEEETPRNPPLPTQRLKQRGQTQKFAQTADLPGTALPPTNKQKQAESKYEAFGNHNTALSEGGRKDKLPLTEGQTDDDVQRIKEARAKFPTRQEFKKHLAEGKTKSVESLNGGINVSSVIEYDDGNVGIFKPKHGETVEGRPGRPLRTYIKPGTYFRREIAASDMAELFGVDDLVPTTTQRTENGDVGSIQEFIPGENSSRLTSNKYGKEEDLVRAAVFDYIIGNTDRHSGNFWIADGKLVLPDNGLSFPGISIADPTDEYSHGDLIYAAVQNGMFIPKEMFDNTTEDKIRTVLQTLPPRAVELTIKRFKTARKLAGKSFRDLPFREHGYGVNYSEVVKLLQTLAESEDRSIPLEEVDTTADPLASRV